MSRRYRSRFGRALAVFIWALTGLALVAMLTQGGVEGLVRDAAWALLPALLVWAMFWRPCVIVDDGGVELVNVFRTIRLPWPSIIEVDTRWALTLHTAYGRYAAWAAPASGWQRGRRLTEQDARAVPAETTVGGSSIRASDSPYSPSGEAAMHVRRHWQALQDAGHLDEPRLEFERPPIRWHVVSIAASAVLIAWAAAGVVL
ncbi:MAG TPA: PH domain-containing protein [Microlunatus sp.]|nr:PH domain-containing protein [Microlunatus sp.]